MGPRDPGEGLTQTFLRLDSLDKRFGDTLVTRSFSLDVGKSEIVTLLGPSGSGKTTVLRLVAGFEAPDSGRVIVEGEEITRLPPERRRIGMVFQHYALFPHMTAGENVAFGLQARHVGKTDCARRVADSLAAVDLHGFEERKVTQLSGGQQQRVALARALAPEPRVLLLDEPLSNLDPTLRERTRHELKRLIRRAGITTLFVTHEQDEAFELGDRVAVMSAGRLEQVGTPEELYENPETRFVATFIGRSSVIAGTCEEGNRVACRVRLAGGTTWTGVALEDFSPGDAVDLVLRPEGVSLSKSSGPDTLSGTIIARRYAGRTARFTVALDGGGEIEALVRPDLFAEGERVFASLAPGGPPPRVFRRGTP